MPELTAEHLKIPGHVARRYAACGVYGWLLEEIEGRATESIVREARNYDPARDPRADAPNAFGRFLFVRAMLAARRVFVELRKVKKNAGLLAEVTTTDMADPGRDWSAPDPGARDDGPDAVDARDLCEWLRPRLSEAEWRLLWGRYGEGKHFQHLGENSSQVAQQRILRAVARAREVLSEQSPV
jgi:hypothetical protein